MAILKLKKKKLSVPVIAAVAATRGIMGLGAGLLLAKRLGSGARTVLGWSLFGIGAASTIPIAEYVRRQ